MIPGWGIVVRVRDGVSSLDTVSNTQWVLYYYLVCSRNWPVCHPAVAPQF